uniref:Protein krueppel n=1 Tax=Anopheles christyi TaxID=43041 RepID=A0A182JT68_9DIPT
MDTQELELTVSAEEICRTCLAAVDRTQLKPIFCNEILDGRIVPFPCVLELATGEKPVKNDKLPNNVCSECKGKLRELYLFVGMAKKSSKLMYEIFNVEPPKPVVESKALRDAKHAHVQTEPAMEAKPTPVADVDLPKHRKRNEIGTQIEMEHFSPDTVEIGCQTDEQFEIETIIVPDTAEQIIKLDDSATSSHGNDLLNENSMDSTLLNFRDDENEYEMILLGDEPNDAESITLRPVESDEKKMLIVETSIPHKEPKILNHRNLLPKVSTDGKQKRSTRRTKSEHCSYCNLTGRPALLAQHFQVHKETLELCLESTDYYRCSNCFMVFLSQMHFVEHVCHRVQPAEDVLYHPDLQKHEEFYGNGINICVPRLKTFSKIGNRYQCGRCIKYTSNNFDAMRQHCLTHESVDEQISDIDVLWKSNLLNEIHICGICNGHFPDATYIRQHLYFHQDSFICVYDCGMIFVSFLRMTRHFERKHLPTGCELAEPDTSQQTEPDAGYSCKLCSKMLVSEASLKNHLKHHIRPRKYVCTECKKCFSQRSDLNNHLRIHTDERPYECKLCEKKFRTNSHLRDHMFTHEDVNKFECDVCHKMFKAKRILAEHTRLHTGEKPYQCKHCSKSFVRKQHLILHQKIHIKAESSGTATKSEKRTRKAS